MVNLNSVLVEGTVVMNPVVELKTSGSECTFKIENVRTYREGDKNVTEISQFPVVTRARMAEVCGEYLRRDSGVRVVGRLVARKGKAYIVAEHVEFRPVKRTV